MKLEPGTLLQVAGDNGAGKTSLLRQVAGLMHLTHGEVLWNHAPIHRDRAHFAAQRLYLGHMAGIKDELTAHENVLINAALAETHCTREESQAVLKALGMGEALTLPCARLSAGQRRRVALARLWFGAMPLWILDEPFTALDQSAVAHLIERMELHLKEGGLCLYTTHQPMMISAPKSLTLSLSGGEARWQ